MDNFWDRVKSIFVSVRDFLELKLFEVGESSITLSDILFIIIGIALLVWFSGWLKRVITRRIASKYEMNIGTVHSIATIIRYTILVIGIIVILQSSGIDLSTLSILAGALGVGIGFGLQNITNNFISGLIILFEQPIKVGDRVTVGDIQGDVIKIAPRATTVNTNDNITLIIPNSEFISSTVINWSHNDEKVALRLPVGVSYNSDPKRVREILLKVIDEEEGILKDPAPRILFDEFGDSSLNFKMHIWTTEYTTRPSLLRSILYYEIFDQFKKEGIEIPFPQRDLHLRSSSVDLAKS